jgi:Tol biopolymer transport system component
MGPSRTDSAPHLTADELTLFFTRDIAIVSATRSSTADPFGEPFDVTSIRFDGGATDAAQRYDIDPSVSADGQTLYFSSTRAGDYDIWKSTRVNGSGELGPPVSVPTAAVGSVREFHPFYAADSGGLWFATDPSATDREIFVAAELSPGAFGTAMKVTSLSSPGIEASPTLSADGLTIYFASNRAGSAHLIDIWMATRPSTSSPFSNHKPGVGVNVLDEQSPGWVSHDQCRLYLSAGDSSTKTYELFVATKPK